MKILELLETLGMDTAVDSLIWWVIIYFLVVNVGLGLLGDIVRGLLKTLARAVWNFVAERCRGGQWQKRRRYV